MNSAPADDRKQPGNADSARESLRRSIPRLLTASAVLACCVTSSALLSGTLAAGGDNSAATAFHRIAWFAAGGLAISSGWLLTQLSRVALLYLSDTVDQSSREDRID